MEDVRFLYNELLIQNQQAFRQKLFATAYHVLSGALYCALSLQDAHLLAEVEHLARVQLHGVTTHFAQHPDPTEPVEVSLYTSLVQIAQTRRILFSDGGPNHR